MLLALYRMRDSFYSVPPTVGLVGDSLQPHSHAGERIAVHLAGIRDSPTTCQLARRLVTEYKFRIGQLVYFHPKWTGRSQVNAAAGPYQIVQRLPTAEDGEFHYEIRSAVGA